MPSAAPIRPRHLVSTQQGVETLVPHDFTPFRDALQVAYTSFRQPARRYGYRGLKIFTSLSLRFQDFQRLKLDTRCCVRTLGKAVPPQDGSFYYIG